MNQTGDKHMKKSFQLKSLVLSMAVAGAASLAVVPATSQAGVSANIGAVSNYIFRGVEQTESASASAGLDYENDSGFYLGTWVADVETGLEYDLYGGWSGSIGEVSLGLGATTFRYTDTAFDYPYNEVNASLGYGMFTIGYDKGVYEDPAGDIDYDHKYIGVEYGSFGVTVGMLDGDLDADDDALTYVDVGYSTELSAGLEGSVTYTYVSPEDSDLDSDTFLVFGVSKSFDIM
ncbi:TorF family putative porin [Thiomicrorhabdus sp. zzn3]|uniref:TorF family putative porin n=1 Tax=Thiomicrorhabdus sp. zzn3 TaxID=3039775 RepID=UPI0024362CA1|nr:TorF family putative porin [Thiomicrorhabdus sp. zzn3]MDG6777273.1 TorF family putative porin [Thiomicrorhabdus sp. zzn3]